MSVKKYFSLGELSLWAVSVTVTLISFFVFDKENYVALTASLIGVTSLIFNAKGNPLGPLLMIVFSTFYGYISYTFDYYGEMITYLGMSAPMSAVAFVSWLKNPYKGHKAQVAIGNLKKKDILLMLTATAVVTSIFYFILAALDTANIIPSTISVATSFLAVYLTYKRSEYYALAYAANDAVLIILWILATIKDISYISVIICFAVFLANDIYGFVNWKRMKTLQRKHRSQNA